MKYLFWIGVGGIALAAAFAGYRYELGQIPYREMGKAEARIAARAGGVNVMAHMPRATAKARTVVRPSPDQLYSACVYDLAAGPVKFVGRAPDNAYWSLSFFGHNSDNFYVVNDRQLADKAFHFVLIREGDSVPEGTPESVIVRSPSQTGVVLQRVFIGEEARADELDQTRSQTSCALL